MKIKIGTRIRDLRISQRFTLKELAKKTGLTTSFLSQLERNHSFPSVNSVEKIASALNTKVGYFFEEEGKGFIFIKKGMGKKSIVEKGKIISESLDVGLLNVKMQPFIFSLGVGAELKKELIYPDGEKFGMVLKGRIEFLCDEEKLIFEKGDSVYCTSTKKLYKMRNIGEREARLLWMVLLSG